MVAPDWTTAEVPGLTGVAFCMAVMEASVGAAALTLLLALVVPSLMRPALLLAWAPPDCRLPRPLLPVTRLVPLWDSFAASVLALPLPVTAALAVWPSLSW